MYESPCVRHVSAVVDLPMPPLPVMSSAPSSPPKAAPCSSCPPMDSSHQWKSVRNGEAFAQKGSPSIVGAQYAPTRDSTSITLTEFSTQ